MKVGGGLSSRSAWLGKAAAGAGACMRGRVCCASPPGRADGRACCPPPPPRLLSGVEPEPGLRRGGRVQSAGVLLGPLAATLSHPRHRAARAGGCACAACVFPRCVLSTGARSTPGQRGARFRSPRCSVAQTCLTAPSRTAAVVRPTDVEVYRQQLEAAGCDVAGMLAAAAAAKSAQDAAAGGHQKRRGRRRRGAPAAAGSSANGSSSSGGSVDASLDDASSSNGASSGRMTARSRGGSSSGASATSGWPGGASYMSAPAVEEEEGAGAGSAGRPPAVPDFAVYVGSSEQLHRVSWDHGVPVKLKGAPAERCGGGAGGGLVGCGWLGRLAAHCLAAHCLLPQPACLCLAAACLCATAHCPPEARIPRPPLPPPARLARVGGHPGPHCSLRVRRLLLGGARIRGAGPGKHAQRRRRGAARARGARGGARQHLHQHRGYAAAGSEGRGRWARFRWVPCCAAACLPVLRLSSRILSSLTASPADDFPLPAEGSAQPPERLLVSLTVRGRGQLLAYSSHRPQVRAVGSASQGVAGWLQLAAHAGS